MFAGWDGSLAAEGVCVRVVIWDDFKTRHLLSDLLGLHLAKDFKTNRDGRHLNTWNRLSRPDGESVAREFHLNSPVHHAHCAFTIGANLP